MEYNEIKNIKWSNSEHTTIDCTLVTDIGELPFTANPLDIESFGRDLFKLIAETRTSEIQAFEAPEEEIPVLRQFTIPSKALKVNTI